MATTTLRIPDPLKREADRFAAKVGMSVNALMAIALRDYLDRPVHPVQHYVGRRVSEPSEVAGRPSPRLEPVAAPEAVSEAPNPYPKPPAGGRSARCPCGEPLKWKQCHGKGVS